ncbi:MAG: triose-phosphate isomerase [Candidatus Dadabacteria bacterium]|nr:MAG: triose-phosphate isomerase [Candidatus Dadabacteria bacterium]
MGRTLYAVANWKMNLRADQSAELAGQLADFSKSLNKAQVWIAPAAVNIPAVTYATESSGIKIGSQNVHWDKNGAYTGEISVEMLRHLNCSFAIVGHSERRRLFLESNELTAKRAVGALQQTFKVIFCVGENLSQRKSGETLAVLQAQLDPLLEASREFDTSGLLIAYEPVWAIGTGKVASIGEIEEAHAAIIDYWQNKANALPPPVLYGGSVKPDNVADILSVAEVSGTLVGGASLNFDSFKDIILAHEKLSC